MSSNATSWGSPYRLIASEKWKAKSAAMGRPLTEIFVDYARPQPGMRVIDLASGTGEPGITLARRVAPTGHVTALDQSAELLEVAAQRAKERGVANFETRQADAHKLPFPDHSFDLATCRFGVMFFARPEEAMADLRRVLKPGARACLVAWGPFEQPFWQSTMKIVHQHVGGRTLEPEAAADPFRFSTPDSLSHVLCAAGFRRVEESTKNVPWAWPGSTEEVFEFARSCSTPFQPLLSRVPEETWPAILRDVHAAVGHYRVGDEIRFGADVILASGEA